MPVRLMERKRVSAAVDRPLLLRRTERHTSHVIVRVRVLYSYFICYRTIRLVATVRYPYSYGTRLHVTVR